MAFDLNPLALANAPLLRLIADATTHEIATTQGLAIAAGRDPSNVGKSLKALQAAGLIHEDPLMNGLTDDGAAQLAALDRAADPTAGGGLSALHHEIDPDDLNPRKDFETQEAEEALNELRASIIKKGLLQPIMVKPGEAGGAKWKIVIGERRWRAIGQAISDGDWPHDRPIKIEVREVDDGEHLEIALVENIQRESMSAIEEGVGLALAVQKFGADTAELAARLGKTRRWVQMRMQLTELPAEDQDRMRLPHKHPDRLGFKAAMALLQRPTDGALQDFVMAVSGRLMVVYGIHLPAALHDRVRDMGVQRLTIDQVVENIAQERELRPLPPREPGSPAATPEPVEPDPIPFGDRLTDKQALMFVEIADKADRDPAADPALASESYTQVQNVPVHGVAAELVAMNAIGFRQKGATVFVRPRLFTTGPKAWLEEIGFYQHREDVLHEMRVRAAGLENAFAARDEGRYVTPWLNAGFPVIQADDDSVRKQPPFAPAEGAEPEQPELIEATAEERAARLAAEAERHADARARAAAEAYARQIGDWMAFARAREAADYLNPPPADGPALTHDDMALALIRAVSTGRTGEAGAILATLTLRLGPIAASDLMARVWREQTTTPAQADEAETA